MLIFGLGTLPNLLLISKFSAALTQFGQYAWVRYFTAALLFTTGGFGIYRAWVLPDALLKGGFCISYQSWFKAFFNQICSKTLAIKNINR